MARREQPRMMSRRQFLKTSAGVGAVLVAGAATSSPAADDVPLIEPEVRRTVNGELLGMMQMVEVYKDS